MAADTPLNQKQLQQSLQDALRQVVSGSSSAAGPAQEAALPVLQQLMPQVFADTSKTLSRTSRLECLQAALRTLCMELAAEAANHSQPPLQYAALPGAEPALQRLLAIARLCTDQHLLDAADLMSLLIDLQDVCVMEHCIDIIAWLEQQRSWLSSPQFNCGAQFVVSAPNMLTRLCNTIFKRLGRHDVANKARLLMLTASCAPLFDRSGMNVNGAIAPAEPPAVEEVPEDAVDSAGKPVNAGLYQTFWQLQALLQDPIGVLRVADNWANFKKGLAAVLTELARSPATVAAVRTADAAAAAAGAAPGAAAAGTAAAEAGGGGHQAVQLQGATQCYLSSYKLFGLQLADSAFRRGFLVQVLVMLRCLLLPGKQPTETLKPKQRMEALELQKQVYSVLDATPARGKDFSRAVRDILEREGSWVEWKKGGKGFVVPGSKGEADASAAAASSSAAGKKAPSHTTCLDWSKPAAAPLAAALTSARETAARKRKQDEDAAAEGLALKAEVDALGRTYDRAGEPFEDPKYKRNRYVKLLGGADASGLTVWAQQHYAAALDGSSPPLLQGLRVAEQPQYPLPQALCAQLLREMDPDTGIEDSYKRVAEDPVYRWRIGRTVAQGLPEYEDFTSPDGLERAMVDMMPACVPPAYKARYDEEAASRVLSKAAGKAAGGRPVAARAGGGAGVKGGAAAAAAAGKAAGGAGGGPASAEAAADDKQEDAAAAGDADAAADAAEPAAADAAGGVDDAGPAAAVAVKEEEDEGAAPDEEVPASAEAADAAQEAADAAAEEAPEEGEAGEAAADGMDVDGALEPEP